MKKDFKDYYSRQAEEYSRYRPTYPDKLFEYLKSVVYGHELAVDCATGSGQAAKGLAKYFNEVIALDASEAQIKNAYEIPNVKYKIATAEETGLKKDSADLVTIATAIHWIDTDLFYKETERILKDNGVIAVWTYGITCDIDPETDNIVNNFSERILEEHWDIHIKKILSFEEMKFPFKRVPSPEFKIRREWTREEYLNYIYTWSSVHKFIESHNSNPMDLLREELKDVWDENLRKEIIWNIQMKAGRK
ncbi:MAG: class I SAM-dependent methyltransferase [Ignavibacteria bacterium]